MVSMTAKLDFAILDVFTQNKYEGNPLAIVNIPKSAIVSQEQKQAIAREFNLSETTFLHEQIGGNLVWTVDIFLTHAEIPFAGHPTIGTAVYALSQAAQSGSIKKGTIQASFRIKAGTVDLAYDVENRSAKAKIPHSFHVHQRKYSGPELKSLQPSLDGTATKESHPIVSVVKGMTFILVELSSLEDLAKVTANGQSPNVEDLDEEWNETFLATYFFVRHGTREDGTSLLRTRMIERTMEDPATGSAATDLAGYLAMTEGKSGETLRYVMEQGVEMGRRSIIVVGVTLGQDGLVGSVYLEGSAVKIMEGTLTI